MKYFQTGLMGPGLAIELDGLDWNVYAPTDAQVSVVFPTGHAVVLQHQAGMEMLIHIGIDSRLENRMRLKSTLLKISRL